MIIQDILTIVFAVWVAILGALTARCIYIDRVYYRGEKRDLIRLLNAVNCVFFILLVIILPDLFSVHGIFPKNGFVEHFIPNMLAWTILIAGAGYIYLTLKAALIIKYAMDNFVLTGEHAIAREISTLKTIFIASSCLSFCVFLGLPLWMQFAPHDYLKAASLLYVAATGFLFVVIWLVVSSRLKSEVRRYLDSRPATNQLISNMNSRISKSQIFGVPLALIVLAFLCYQSSLHMDAGPPSDTLEFQYQDLIFPAACCAFYSFFLYLAWVSPPLHHETVYRTPVRQRTTRSNVSRATIRPADPNSYTVNMNDFVTHSETEDVSTEDHMFHGGGDLFFGGPIAIADNSNLATPFLQHSYPPTDPHY